MSAECGKCGFDIVYPPGTWPVGECLNCKQNDQIDALRQALTEIHMMKMRFHPIAGYQFDADPRTIAAAALFNNTVVRAGGETA